MAGRRSIPRLLAIGFLMLALSAVTPASDDAAAAGERTPEPSNTAWSTSCDREASGYQPVRGLDLPTAADWRETTPPYAFDRIAAVEQGYDRVGYCLELTGDDGTEWVWASMESPGGADLVLPTHPGEVRQQYVDDLTVASNVSAVTSLDHGSGWLEMWPNKYAQSGAQQVPGASDSTFDADDSVQPTMGYGSFQVHAFTDPQDSRGPHNVESATATPVLAVNAFTAGGTRTMDVGVGPSAGDNPDWTFASNAGDYTIRRLTFFARPAIARADWFPASRQVIPRPGQTDTTVPVTISGATLSPDVTAVELRTTRDGRQAVEHAAVINSRFSVTTSLPVALTSTDLELWALTADGASRRIDRAVDVVAGDVYVVHGQSNAAAAAHGGSAAADRSRWVRTFGTPHYDPDIALGTDGWTYGAGDLTYRPGFIGQWATRLGNVLSAEQDVPLAIVNGARGGRRISYFTRNDAEPTDPSTDYGRLLQRLTRAGLTGPDVIDAMLWYQGETDADNAAAHVAGFTDLVGDWRHDLDADLRVYAHQVRYSPCNSADEVALRDAQRRLPDTIDNLRVLSTTALNGTNKCHFTYLDGYRTLGDQNTSTLLVDLYGRDLPGVFAPDPRLVHRVDDRPDELAVTLRAPNDPLSVEEGAADDFRVSGAVVESVRWQRGRGLVLGLDRPAPSDAVVSYHAHVGAGPRIMTSTGVGLLAFRLPVV